MIALHKQWNYFCDDIRIKSKSILSLLVTKAQVWKSCFYCRGSSIKKDDLKQSIKKMRRCFSIVRFIIADNLSAIFLT